MTPELARAARGALHISRPQLADMVGAHHKTIQNFESGLPIRGSTRDKIKEVLTAQGAAFRGDHITITPPASK